MLITGGDPKSWKTTCLSSGVLGLDYEYPHIVFPSRGKICSFFLLEEA